MAEPNIKHARIDNRLVHGQVGNTWVGATRPNLIIVADDEAAKDSLQQAMMKMTADAAGCGIRFFTLQKTIDVIWKASPQQAIFIVCRTPKDMRTLIEGNVPIKEVNVGNMHDDGTGTKKVYKEPHVYCDSNDLEDFEAIKKKGVKLYIQLNPTDHRINI